VFDNTLRISFALTNAKPQKDNLKATFELSVQEPYIVLDVGWFLYENKVMLFDFHTQSVVSVIISILDCI